MSSPPAEVHSSLRQRAATTYKLDLLRAPLAGILEAGWTTFGLLVAIRFFDAPEGIKAVIAGAGPLGFLLAPAFLYTAARLNWSTSQAGGLTLCASAVLIWGVVFAPNLWFFAAFLVGAQIFGVQQNTLSAQIYSSNYGAQERGSRVALPFVLVAIAATGFAFVGGAILDWKLQNYPLIFAIMGLAAVGAALCFAKFPSTPLSLQAVKRPLQSLGLVGTDRLFGYLLFAWMLLGMGNLMTLPLRVEYLADPRYGINANNTVIALLLLIIPATCRILSTHLWGRLFDRLKLMTTRNLLNLCFLLSTSFFFFENIYWLALSMAALGFATGGGKIMWSLWVTKLASSDKVAGYMSVHMFLTGVRGVLAPFLGYWMLSASNPQLAGAGSAALIILASILFTLVRHHPRLK